MRVLRGIARVLRASLTACGVVALTVVVLGFTPYPWRMYRWLGTDAARLQGAPDFIVLLSGGGIPSESGLTRAYRTAQVAEMYPSARVIVAMAEDAAPDGGSFSRMRRELMMRGVLHERLLFERKGRNTREQALNVRKLLERETSDPVLLIVTSPEHLRRALLTFRKAGFTRARGDAVFSASVNKDFTYEAGELGASPALAPDIGDHLMLRYILWDNLALEVKILREWAGLAYYWAMDWI